MKTFMHYVLFVLALAATASLICLPGIFAAIDGKPTLDVVIGLLYPLMSFGLGVPMARLSYQYRQRHPRYQQRKWRFALEFLIANISFILLAFASIMIERVWSIRPTHHGGIGGGYLLGYFLVRAILEDGGTKPASSSPSRVTMSGEQRMD
jgi:hypothetical protein